MSSKVEIVNLALSTYLGAQRINSLEEETPMSLQAVLHFPHVRRELLEMWDWSFARKRVALAKLATNDRPEWATRFAMPVSCMRIRWVNDPMVAKDAYQAREIYDTEREIAGKFIYSDLPSATMEYIHDEDDVTTYPELFVQAFAATLAVKMAASLRESASAGANAQDAAMSYLDEAKAHDARQYPPIKVVNMVNWAGVR